MSENNVMEVEALCVNCKENGKTLMMLVNIPYFKDVIVSSFECEHCKYTDRYVHSADSLNSKGGCRLELNVHKEKDLSRQLVISQHATFLIPHLKFEIPPLKGNHSSLTTVEGKILQIKESLLLEQQQRRSENPELANQIDGFIQKLVLCATLENKKPYTIIIDDPSGNSFIEPLDVKNITSGMEGDSNIEVSWYEPTEEQRTQMGFSTSSSAAGASANKKPKAIEISNEKIPECFQMNGWDLNLSVEENLDILQKRKNIREDADKHSCVDPESDSVTFAHDCPQCGSFTMHQMCVINIPGFKKCLIMAFKCSNCGFKSNEIKPMGEIGKHARKWTLKVENADDLNRDVLKSETCTIQIPELELEESCSGTLGGVFTTVEGILLKIIDQLTNQCAMFMGDSADPVLQAKLDHLINSLKQYTQQDSSCLPFTLILDDPSDLSIISHRHSFKSVFSQNDDNSIIYQWDDQLKNEEYQRTKDQDDALGLLDMKVENYEA